MSVTTLLRLCEFPFRFYRHLTTEKVSLCKQTKIKSSFKVLSKDFATKNMIKNSLEDTSVHNNVVKSGLFNRCFLSNASSNVIEELQKFHEL